MATPMGVLRAALAAGPPSAAPRAAVPVPASVVMVPSWQHLADALGAAIGDEEIAGGIQGQGRWLEELGHGGGPAIADGMHVAIAGDGGDVGRQVHTTYADGVGDIEVAADVGGQVVHRIERGTGGATAIARKARGAGAGVTESICRRW